MVVGKKGQAFGKGGLELLPGNHHVDQPLFQKELGGLEPFGQVRPDGLLDHPGPSEADDGSRLGQDQVTQECEGGADAAEGGIGEQREYRSKIMVGGKQVEGYGTACLQPDGSWRYGPAQAESY